MHREGAHVLNSTVPNGCRYPPPPRGVREVEGWVEGDGWRRREGRMAERRKG